MGEKKMILCDTNILIEVYKGNLEIIETLKEIGQENITVSDVTCGELFFGARNKRELQVISKDIDKLIVIPVNSFISAMAIKLVKEYSLSHKLALPNALIGATAIYHRLQLYTLNVKDFKFLNDIKLFSI